MGLFYKVYCPLCYWLHSPDGWKRIQTAMWGRDDVPLGLMQRSVGGNFERGNQLFKPSDIPATFSIVKGRLMDSFKLWVSNLWIDEDDLKSMGEWLRGRIRVVAGIPLPRRAIYISAKAGEVKKREL